MQTGILNNMRDLSGRVTAYETSYYSSIGGMAHISKGKLTVAKPPGAVQVVIKRVRQPCLGLDEWPYRIHLTPSSQDHQPELTCHQKLLRESNLWSTLCHPNIAPIYGVAFDLGQFGEPALVAPYYRHGDITKYLKAYPHADRIRLAAQLAAAMSHLHSCDIVHGGKQNVLVNDSHDACLTDFGLSRVMEASGYTTDNSHGTVRWMAYELLYLVGNGPPPPVTKASDVWAFAMTVLEIFTGRLPFSHCKSDGHVVVAVVSGLVPQREVYPEVSDSVWAVLERCWDKDPDCRPSMRALALFFDGVRLNALEAQWDCHRRSAS